MKRALGISHQSKEFVEIINKLVKDGYIGVTGADKQFCYSLFEGRSLVANGGYKKLNKSIADKEAINDSIMEYTLSNLKYGQFVVKYWWVVSLATIVISAVVSHFIK